MTPSRSFVTEILRIVLTIGLIVPGVLKLTSGWSQEVLISESLFYCVAIAEMIAGVLLWTRWKTTCAAYVVVGLLIAGIIGLVIRGGQCGCLGRHIQLDSRWRFIWVAVEGVVAVSYCRLARCPSEAVRHAHEAPGRGGLA